MKTRKNTNKLFLYLKNNFVVVVVLLMDHVIGRHTMLFKSVHVHFDLPLRRLRVQLEEQPHHNCSLSPSFTREILVQFLFALSHAHALFFSRSLVIILFNVITRSHIQLDVVMLLTVKRNYLLFIAIYNIFVFFFSLCYSCVSINSFLFIFFTLFSRSRKEHN